MLYAIVEANGKQLWVQEKRFYDINRLSLQSGDRFNLNRVLLLRYDKITDSGYGPVKYLHIEIGKPFIENVAAEAVVIRHLSGSKIRVYKMRPKKKTRKTIGFRSKLTRIYIFSIGRLVGSYVKKLNT